MSTDKSREDRVRRTLRKMGFRLNKSPTRAWERTYCGPGYMILDNRNYVVAGCCNRQYEMTLSEVEEFASDRQVLVET